MTLFRLVLGDFERSLDLNFEKFTEERLAALVRRADECSQAKEHLVRSVVDALTPLAEVPSERPSKKQRTYADAICAKLGKTLPKEAEVDIQAMSRFLTEYAPVYRRKRIEERLQKHSGIPLRTEVKTIDEN